MDAADLRVFEAVARLGGMSRAAAELNTVQSNVTTRIRLLEQELGIRLFDRNRRGTSLTAAGRRLLPYAHRVETLLADAKRVVADDGTPRGALSVGSLETTAALRLSPVLARYAAAYPAVDVSLLTGTTAELIDAVLERRVEGAFVCGPVDHPVLDQEPVFVEELVVATAPDVTSLAVLTETEHLKIVILRSGCSYRQRLEDILMRRGIVGLRQLEFGTIEGIIGSVAAGLGVTLLPRGVVEPARRAGRIAIHSMPPSEAQVETLFIRRRDMAVTSALAAFLDNARPARVAVKAASRVV